MTRLSSSEMLTRLGAGQSIADVCAAAGLSREQFDAWWRGECCRRVPPTEGVCRVRGPRSRVEIRRDRWGVPHIFAESDGDLFFGFGYATAQDRLFQLDHWRRKARGRLAEILGRDALESDILYRTLGLTQAADAEWAALPADTRAMIGSYSAGINALIEQSRGRLPIEFDLLGYEPELWTPEDSMVIAKEARWYMTGRLPVIVIPELAKRALGQGPLYCEFLLGEADDESIVPPGAYPARPAADPRVGAVMGEDGGPGSNNWVLAGTRTATSKPLVANDPHVPFGAVSIWYQVCLRGGSFHVAGVSMVGQPGVIIGRNERVAWGITNNICSLRDLYQEKTDPAHPDCFLYDGRWEPARQREEVIYVKGMEPVRKVVRSSRNGPIVDEVLPSAARPTGPVALRWLGVEPCGWLTAMIAMNRSRTAEEFREALRPWHVPTFNLVFADVDGHTSFQSVGRIPVRDVAERGYRPGWDPRHQWDGLISFEDMPQMRDPKSGFAITANNRLAPDDYPYPLAGTWSGGHRARRIRELIEARPKLTREDCQQLQQDVFSGRAAECVPALVALLADDPDPYVRRALAFLKAWDFRVVPDSIAAALFNVFFSRWCRTVTAERFPADQAELVAANAGGLAARLLAGDKIGWFAQGDCGAAVRRTFRAALDELTARLGPEDAAWTWGRLHPLVQKHFLSGRGELGQLLDHSSLPIGGDGTTINSGTTDARHAAYLGAGYRMVADLADPAHGLWSIEAGSVSGHPGSPHYDDQLALWAEGGYHYLSVDGEQPGGSQLVLEPKNG
jgi:penicillin amidase